jgi:hypothetical protein
MKITGSLRFLKYPRPNDTLILNFFSKNYYWKLSFWIIKKSQNWWFFKISNNGTTLVDTHPNNDLNLPSRTAPLHNGAAACLSALLVREKTYMNGCQLVFNWSPTFWEMFMRCLLSLTLRTVSSFVFGGTLANISYHSCCWSWSLNFTLAIISFLLLRSELKFICATYKSKFFAITRDRTIRVMWWAACLIIVF